MGEYMEPKEILEKRRRYKEEYKNEKDRATPLTKGMREIGESERIEKTVMMSYLSFREDVVIVQGCQAVRQTLLLTEHPTPKTGNTASMLR